MKIRNEAWGELYHAVNKMMLRLGADGEINAQQVEVEYVMSALHGIDGGSYNTKRLVGRKKLRSDDGNDAGT